MEYSIGLGFYTKKLKLDFNSSVQMLTRVGFTALDYTSDLRRPDWQSNAERELAVIEANGLHVHQTHAPFDRYGSWGQDYGACLERAYEITKTFGAKYLVVHGDEFDFERYDFSPERALEYNYELFAPYVEKAEKDGVYLAFETVFEDDLSPARPRFCSKAEDLKALIEKFNSYAAVCCWDFGHAHISFGAEQPDKIRLLGKYIKCTHVHDNRLGEDLHQPLFMGDSDLVGIRRAFDDIGYDGNFSLELGGAPKMNLVPSVLEAYTEFAYNGLVCFDNLK